jgi:hypothetical protein
MGTRHLVVGALCAVLLLGGCAQGSSNTGPGASMSPSAEPSSSPSSPSPEPPELSLPPSASDKAGTMTLTGTVEPGVEAGCLLMKTGGKTYLLIGGDRNVVKAGARVQVTGRLAPDIKSYCMQGTAFQVTAASAA